MRQLTENITSNSKIHLNAHTLLESLKQNNNSDVTTRMVFTKCSPINFFQIIIIPLLLK